ncbi:MAG: flavodoxin domain-containing protein [Gemmatimonadota bacterium]
MPRILIFFGTTDGHTAKVAHVLGENLQNAGATVHIVDAGAGHSDPRPRDYDAVIVAASIHISAYQPSVSRWVRTHNQDLSGMPTAFLSICLGVLQPEPEVQKELTRIMEKFFASVGWRPTVSRSVAGALLYTRYGWLKRWMMHRMSRKAGVETDTSRDYEYTDWGELRALAESFLERVERSRRVLALR